MHPTHMTQLQLMEAITVCDVWTHVRKGKSKRTETNRASRHTRQSIGCMRLAPRRRAAGGMAVADQMEAVRDCPSLGVPMPMPWHAGV